MTRVLKCAIILKLQFNTTFHSKCCVRKEKIFPPQSSNSSHFRHKIKLININLIQQKKNNKNLKVKNHKRKKRKNTK